MFDESGDKKVKYWSADEAKLNIQSYCAYQERCHQEVRNKLLQHGIYGDLLEELISDLIVNNFLNEERFAKTFAGGKFRIKHWGRNKIRQELKLKNVSDYSIREGLKEIRDDDYLETIKMLIDKKERTTKFANKYDRVQKLTVYLAQKGFEFEAIKEVLG
jgi:regulatory protein